MARLLEEKPLRKALAEVLGMKDKMRVEVAAKRYKESLSRWSASPSLELAADLWKKRLKSRSEAPWIQFATEKYRRAMERFLLPSK